MTPQQQPTPEQALNLIDGVLSEITAIGSPGRGLTRNEQANLQQAVILIRQALAPPEAKPTSKASEPGTPSARK